MSRCRTTAIAGATALLVALGAGPVEAQLRPQAANPQVEGPAPLDISPGGAFWRALLVPGWGHASIGSYGRAGFYMSVQSATVYSLIRARMRLHEAEDRVRFREDLLTARLAAEGTSDPDEVATQLEADTGLSELSVLLDSRKEQQEDLIAFTLAMVFISAADAYVSAHLARFPEPLDIGAEPSANGGIDLALKVRLPN